MHPLTISQAQQQQSEVQVQQRLLAPRCSGLQVAQRALLQPLQQHPRVATMRWGAAAAAAARGGML